MKKLYKNSPYSQHKIALTAGWLPQLLLLLVLCLTGPVVMAQVSGTVFQDFNFDGTKTTTSTLTEAGIQGVTVTATDLSGASATVTTGSSGVYTFPNSGVTASGKTVRLEFSGLPNFAQPGIAGGTSVQFVIAGSGANNVNFGISYPNDYCQKNPFMITPCYVESSNPNMDVVVKFSYNNTGKLPLDKSAVANFGQVGGSLWGMAYSRTDSIVYAAAVLKSHIPLGTAGLDAIYSINPFTATVTPWLQLKDDLGIDVSSVTANPQYATNAARGVDASPQNDAGAFTDALKVGLGDIELSADEKTLYVVNLYDKKLYAISTATKQLTGTYSIPTTGCNNGVARPFAIGEQNGQIYVGVTCDGSSSGVPSVLTDNSGVDNLTSTVYRLDGSSFTQVLSVPLNYPKEVPFQYSNGCNSVNRWKPWTDVLPATCADGNIGYPTPLLTDIEFSDNGDMILGFTDRTGFQFGNKNYGPTGTTLYSMYAGGDILKACKTTSGWQIEDVAGGCTNTRGFAINTNDPTGYNNSTNNPKAGEFYEGDYFHENGGIDNTGLSWFPGHPEITVGALAVVPGTNEVMSTSYDPVTGADNYTTGGVITLNNSSGKRPRNGFQLYNSNITGGDGGITAGKGVGFGDLEALCAPAPIEIGNRIWKDTDKDGIQDAGEEGVDGVEIELYEGTAATGSPVKTVTSATLAGQKGTWYFTDLKPNLNYVIKVKTALGAGALATCTAFSATGAGTALIDNNTGNGTITLKTGNAGENNHTYDIGVREGCVNPVASVSSQTQTICVGGTATAFTATPSTGVDYTWYGPLTTATGSLGTAIAGQTSAAFTPTGAALTTEGVKYYAVVVNTTGNPACADTAFVTLTVSKITVPAATALCHANGTPEDASDDYMTFSIKVTDTPISLHTFTVTATQAGNPLAVTLSNGSPATALNCGLDAALRTPAGSAGKGNVTLTITDNVTGCSTTLTITEPGTCAVVCVDGTPSTVSYQYATQTDVTELEKLPIILPKFDEKGGSRVLKSVKLEYTVGGKTALIFENRAAQQQSFEADASSEASVELNGTNIATSTLTLSIPQTTLPGGILVPAQGSWAGDSVQSSIPTTLGRMASWVSDYLVLFKDPRTDPRWVTNATGTDTNDDDMFVAPFLEDTATGSFTYTSAGDLAPFIGTGNVPLNVSILSGLTLSGGGGNLFYFQRTRACASAKVTYTYECVELCVLPTRLVAATDPTCAVAGKIELTATNGDKYGISKGATYTGPAYAAAMAVGTLPLVLKNNISHTADSSWTIRVFNKSNNCFKDTTVTVKALVKDVTVAINNGFPVCRDNGTAYTIKFTKSPIGAIVTAKNVATGAVIAVTGDSVANILLSVAKVRLIVTNGVCIDSVDVDAPVCDKPVGSIGDLIWKDVNDNGLQDLPAEKGVAGVKVNLYAAAAGTKTGSVLQTKTTGTDGLYLFTGLLAGSYIVEIDKTSLPDTCEITTKQNIPGDDTKDSDFNPTTGLSQVITLTPVFNPKTPADILATNNLTVDAGLAVPCIKSSVTVTAAPVCSANVQTYSLTFSVNKKVGTVKVDKGTLTGSNPYTVTGIPSGATVKITDSLSAVCKFDTLITSPNCNCNPPLPILITSSLTACIGDTFPTLKATVIGLATVEWFTQATGGTAVFTGLNYKPTGTVPAGGAVFYAQARSTDPTCPAAISASRVMATVNAQNCTVEVDLALSKSINTKIAQIGDELTYTIKVFNQSNTAATGVEVTDSIATTVQFVAGSFVASRGSAVISGNVIKWTIGGIAANPGTNGDTVTLTYKVKATQEGVHFNTAEISKTNEKDIDSTPGNGEKQEDDIESQCFTVPFKLCAGEKLQADVPATLTNVQWFKDGGSTAIASGNSALLADIGTYTFTATNQTCPAGGCCPIIIEGGVNCCPEDLCIPFTIKKRKK